LIYFGQELQKTLLPLFHFALKPDGILLLGSAETIGGFGRLFAPIDQKARLYRRVDHPVLRTEIGFPAHLFSTPVGLVAPPPCDRPSESLQTVIERILLEKFCPAAVLVNADGDILYIHGRTGKYLEPAVGKANLNIHAMAREGLRYPLTTVIKRALRQTEPIHLPGIRITDVAPPHVVNVFVQGLERSASGPDLAMIVFVDVETLPAAPRQKRKAVDPSTQTAVAEELLLTRHELDVTRGEMQSSLEELKSANEEQQATNEELQSVNEELTTSKEEMQSMNEELHSVNAELQAKIDDLLWVNNDMRNLLNSTEIATIFLDEKMQVRRFTPHATQFFKLIPGDVGRSLSDIVTDLIYPELQTDAADVLRTLMFVEKQISTHDTRWVKVRIMPYRTQDNVIDGVVITFIDITEIKNLEAELRRLRLSPP
jgi:PAS domain S-box-containing protein